MTDLPGFEQREIVVKPERLTDQVVVNLAGERKSYKIDKPQGWEKKIFRAAADAGFLLPFPDNPHGLICAGAAFDGVSTGGRGHECSFNAAKALRARLETQLTRGKKDGERLSRDEIAGLVAGEIIPEINRARYGERMKLKTQQGALEDNDSYYTSIALFLVQEKFDNETGKRKPVAHVICDADSDVAVYLETKSGKRTLLGLNLPHNIAGDRAKNKIKIREQGFQDAQGKPIVTVQMVDSMSLREIERIYRQERKQVEEELPGLTSVVTSVMGEDPSKFKLYYTRVELPQEGDIYKGEELSKVRLVAYTDGIDGHSTVEERKEAISGGSGSLDEAQRLVALVRDKDPDDRLAVVAQVNLAAKKSA